MKSTLYFLIVIFLLSTSYAFPQNITLTPQGVMFPQMSTTQIEALSSQAKGTMVFDNTLNVMKYWDGTNWNVLSNSGTGGTWQSNGDKQYSSNLGSVGIGQSNPFFKLDVLHDESFGMRIKSSNGSSFMALEAANENTGIEFRKTDLKNWLIQSVGNSDEFHISGMNDAVEIKYNTGIVRFPQGVIYGNYGSILGHFRFGTTTLGSSTNNTYSQPVTFPFPMPNANYIVTFSQSHTSFDDFFQIQVRDKTKDGFTIWARRRDSNTGWGQILNVDWVVMAP